MPLAPLAELSGARLRPERLQEVLAEDGLALTDGGAARGFDRLVVAVGARAEPVMDGAVTFAWTADVPVVRQMLRRVVQGGRRGLQTRLAFVVPPGAVWPLPAYELALQTDRLLRRRGVRDRVSLILVTAEDAPLGIFGTLTSRRWPTTSSARALPCARVRSCATGRGDGYAVPGGGRRG